MSNQTDAKIAKIVDVTTARFFAPDVVNFATYVPEYPLCIEPKDIANVHIVKGETLGIFFQDGTHINFSLKVKED